jgi:hypothetical protein
VPKNGYDGFGCRGQGSIPECRYCPETGRIEDSDILKFLIRKGEKIP